MDTILTFENNKHQKIRGKMYRPDDNKGQYPVVIFSHGFGGCFADLEHHGPGFVKEGICCFLFDFCGGGLRSTSDGTMIEMTVPSECEDLFTVIEEIKKLDYIDEKQVFLLGESQGGLVSALCAAKIQDQIKGLLLWYPAFVIPDDSKKRFEKGENDVFGQKISPLYNETSMKIDVYKEIPQYKKDVFLIHGDKDNIVPIVYSEKAKTEYKHANLIVIPNAGHGFEGIDSHYARGESITFIKRCLSMAEDKEELVNKQLPGNALNFLPDYDQVFEKSLLRGKKIIFLGSSVTYGAASLGIAFPEFLAARNGITFIKEAVSGTTLVTQDEDSYIPRMKTIDKSVKPDYFICQLSTNDATQGKPMGKISTEEIEKIDRKSLDTTTISGAIEYIISYATETWHCPIFFYTGTKYESKAYERMVKLLYQIKEKWNIGIIDLWNDDKLNQISTEEYNLYMKDPIHPTQAGYGLWWTPKFEEVLLTEK